MLLARTSRPFRLALGSVLATTTLLYGAVTLEMHLDRDLDPAPPAELVRLFPPQPANAAALELDRRAAAAGIVTATVGASTLPRPQRSQRQAFSAVSGALRKVVRSGLEPSCPDVPDLPASAVAYLSAHAAEIDAIEELALTWEPPRRPLSIQRIDAAPMPNMMGHLEVQRLLLGRALERLAAGDEPRAMRSLEAAWRLGGALRERPEMVSQVMVDITDRDILDVVLKASEPPPPWLDRAATDDPLPRMARAMATTTWLVTSSMRRGSLAAGGGPSPRNALGQAMEGLAHPMLRSSAADYEATLRRALRELAQHSPCAMDPDATDKHVTESMAPWNLAGRAAAQKVGSAWMRASQSALRRELVAAVLAARADRRGGGSGVLADAPSRVCPGSAWRSRAEPDGAVTIALDPPPRPQAWRFEILDCFTLPAPPRAVPVP